MSSVARSIDTSETAAHAADERRACHMRHNSPPPASPQVSGLSVPDSPAGITFGSHFPSSEMVESAAALLPRREAWDGSEWNGKRYRITVGPGVLVTSSTDVNLAEKRNEREHQRRQKEVDAIAAEIAATGEPPAPAPAGDGIKQKITGWSAKSRANMIKTLAMLDYEPMFETGGMPAMVTLTYPGCSTDAVLEDREAGRSHECDERCPSRQAAPDGRTVKKHLDTFRKRFRRAWGDPHAVWKLEFQRRGAPHLHMFLTVPTGKTKGGETFKQWLSRTWTEVLLIADDEERAKHLAAGTGVDYSEGFKAADPQRLAVYFSKHGSAQAGGVKEYQNEVPEGFGDVGRFWGYWRLAKAVVTVDVEREHYVALARVERKVHAAKNLTRRQQVWRQKVNKRTGEIRWKKRWTTRKTKRFRGSSGFVTKNDAPVSISELARYLDQVPTGAQERKAKLAAAGFTGKEKINVQGYDPSARLAGTSDVPALWSDSDGGIWDQ